MRFTMMMTAVAAAGLLATAAQAQSAHQAAPQTDQYRAALEKVILGAQGGVCAEDVMAADLLAACQSQIDGMAERLSSLGPITAMRFVRAQGEGPQRIETYFVEFQGGEILTWRIGGVVDGKFLIVAAGG